MTDPNPMPQPQQPEYPQPPIPQQFPDQPQQPIPQQFPQMPQGQQQPQQTYAQPSYAQQQYGYPMSVPTQKSKLAAGLLGIFLGAFGVHNFYLGHTGKAVAQLLLTLIGWILFGLGPLAACIWSLVESILILCSHPGSPWHRDARNIELAD